MDRSQSSDAEQYDEVIRRLVTNQRIGQALPPNADTFMNHRYPQPQPWQGPRPLKPYRPRVQPDLDKVKEELLRQFEKTQQAQGATGLNVTKDRKDPNLQHVEGWLVFNWKTGESRILKNKPETSPWELPIHLKFRVRLPSTDLEIESDITVPDIKIADAVTEEMSD